MLNALATGDHLPATPFSGLPYVAGVDLAGIGFGLLLGLVGRARPATAAAAS